MPKRKYIAEEDDSNDGYADAQCPECGAILNVRFRRGRDWRKLQCRVCHKRVTVAIEKETAPLIQIGRAGAE